MRRRLFRCNRKKADIAADKERNKQHKGMNEFYRQERERQARISRVIGIALAVLSHVVLLIFGVFSGLKYIYPPPPEQAVLIDFVETERQRPVQQIRGTQPKSVNANPEEDINLVQKSEAQLEGTRQNEAQERSPWEKTEMWRCPNRRDPRR